MSESLVSRLLADAASRPANAAIVDERGSVSYGDLAGRALAVATRLDALGVRAGDTLALSFEASAESVADFASVLYGAGYLGAAILPLYPGVPTARRTELVERFAARWNVARGAEDLGTKLLPLAEICDISHRSLPAPPQASDAARVFYYQFSSGTSGTPKALAFTHRQFFLSARSNVATYGWGPGDRLVPALPAPGKVGLRYLLRVLFAGATCVNLPFPDTRHAMGRAIAEFGITGASASPWQLRRLLASPASTADASRSLRFLAAIGARIGAEEVRALRASVTQNLHVGYGSTESGLIATLRPQDDPADGYTPVAGLVAEVADPAGARLPYGAEGMLRLRAPWLPSGYAGNAEETAKRFRGGWFYPGDFGSQDASGRLHLLGRSDGTINYGGAMVVPEEVEAVLLAHLGVAEAVVTSVPDAMAGEIPVAFIEFSPPATLETLKALCEARLDANSVPALLLAVQRMPRTADGKVARAQLKEHARSLSHMFHSTKP